MDQSTAVIRSALPAEYPAMPSAARVFASTVVAVYAAFAAGAPAIVARPGGFPQDAIVEVGDDFFAPQTVRVTAGTTVVWHTAGTNGHTVTSDTGLFDSGIDTFLRQGDTFQVTFDVPGTYAYYCLFHGGPGGVAMAGTIIVEGATAAPVSPSPTPTLTRPPTETPTAIPTATPFPTPAPTLTRTPTPTREPAPTATPPPAPTSGPAATATPGRGDGGGNGISPGVAGGIAVLAAIGLVAGLWLARRRR
jgi:plastocyanin